MTRSRTEAVPGGLWGELRYPAQSAACVLAIIVFALVFIVAVSLVPAVGGIGSIFALLLLAITVPALSRFLVQACESRAAGREVEPPGVELFVPAGSGGLVFPLFCNCLLAALILPALHVDVPAWTYLLSVIGSVALPAVLGVYVITNSPAQAMNPVAGYRLVQAIGIPYCLAPAYIAVAAGLFVVLLAVAWWLGLFVGVYLLLALYTLLGGMLRTAGLLEAVEIVADEEIRASSELRGIDRERRTCLNHAYGLFSRDNRAGAMDYLAKWLTRDPDPAGARAWCLEQMVTWEDKLPALYFGQEYLGWLLAGGEHRRAVKLMLRLHRVDGRFRPAPADMAAAVAILRQSGNAELADELEARVS